MKLKIAVRLLQLLSTRPEQALTTNEILRKWELAGEAVVTLRSVQRYMLELAEDSVEGPALVEKVERQGEQPAYYLKASMVAAWFVTEEAALDLQLTRQVYVRAFGARETSHGPELADMAEQIINAKPELKRLRARLQIVPDGIGRLPAQIDHRVLQAAIEAISKEKKLRLDYKRSAGRTSSELITPLGLVAKDGTIYLVAIRGLSDPPRHYAMQRVSHAEVHFHRAQARDDFDLTQHIQATHQFSHGVGDNVPPLKLNLRVHESGLFHFKERPLGADQAILAPRRGSSWHTVIAEVPNTMLLKPFLASLGPTVEVLEPAGLRNELAQWLHDAAGHYGDDRKRRQMTHNTSDVQNIGFEQSEEN